MPRYFIEVAYMGTAYAGFQVQENAHTVQAELEQALQVFYRRPFCLTGSSRTDTGVHALQNYFHFDSGELDAEKDVYHLNALLPPDLVVRKIQRVKEGAHCRFDALSRAYEYRVYRHKDPFLRGRAFFYPYRLDRERLNAAAECLLGYEDFSSFSKKNTQVKNFVCRLEKSEWTEIEGMLLYRVAANRFLRGMVKGLVGTMLRVGTGRMNLDEFRGIIEKKQLAQADFSVPPHGLYLVAVRFPADVFECS